MQNHKLKSLVAITLAIVGVSSQAQQSTAEQLNDINARRAVIEAQVKEAKALKELNDLNQQNGLIGASAKKNSPTLDADSDYGTPTVSYVEGAKGRLEAVLVYRGNVKQRVKAGDAIYGAVVQKISLNEVILLDVKAKSLVRLQFASGPVTRDSSFPQPGGAVPTVLPPGMPAGAR